MRRPRWPLHAGRFVQLYCSLTWDDSYASSCSGCGPPGAANMRNDMYHGELGNSAATKLHTIRASSKTCLVIFSRSVGVNLLLNCYTVAATQTLSISPSLPSSLVRYTNRPSPSGHQTRYAKRLTIIQALLWTGDRAYGVDDGHKLRNMPEFSEISRRSCLHCQAKLVICWHSVLRSPARPVRHVCRYITAARPGKAKGMSHFILRLAVVTTSVCMIEITGNGCVFRVAGSL